jgi:ribosomal protein S18 acetylase RimI-like enzyme
MKMASWAYERGAFWTMELSGASPIQVQPRIVVDFREVFCADAEPLASAMGLPDASQVLQRFDSGCRCVAAWIDASIVAYGWISQEEEYIGGLEQLFHIPAGERYIWDCATLSSYQNQHIYSALLSNIAVKLSGERINRLWIGAALKNRPSIHGFSSAGFQPVAKVTYLRVFHMRYRQVIGYPTVSPDLVKSIRGALQHGDIR